MLTIPTPAGFRFWPAVTGHGWCELPPFDCDEAARTLARVHRLDSGPVVRVTLRDGGGARLLAEVEGLDAAPTPAQTAEIEQMAARCLGLDHDLSAFYALVRDHPRYGWIARAGAGWLLRSPTVWEDLAKTLLTTNTTWRMTIQMCRRLVALGDPYPGGGHAFPTPEQIASLSLAELDAQVRAGYRGAYLHLLASRIAGGELAVETWRDPQLTSADLYRRVKSLKGFGDYAAGSMLKLLGHYDRLATDTECRAAYRDRINGGVPAADDREIAAYYQPFGAWRGLVQWMDVMESYLRPPA